MNIKQIISVLVLVIAAFVTTNVAYAVNCGDGVALCTCGNTLTASVTLNSSHSITDGTACAGNGLVIGKGGITLDCNGTTIIGTRQNSGISLTSAYNNVTVKNCYITNFTSGIYISGSTITNFTVKNSWIYNNSGDGIFLGGTNSYVDNSSVFNNGDDGIELNSYNNNTITNNNITRNIDNGIAVTGSDNNTIRNNTITNNGVRGILVQSSSHNNSLLNNHVTGHNGNSDVGIDINSGNNNLLEGNYINDSFYGVYIESSGDYTTVRNNTINGSSSIGLYVYYGDSNTITNNMIGMNRQGIYYYFSNSNTFINNTVASSYNNNGISISYSDSNTFRGNLITNNSGNSNLVSLGYSSDGNLFLNNTLEFCSNHCFYSNGQENNLTDNVMRNISSSGYGIYLDNYNQQIGSGNTLDGDTIYYYYSRNAETVQDIVINRDKLIYPGNLMVVNSTNMMIINVTVSKSYYGIYISNNDNLTLKNSTIHNNSDTGIYLSNTANSTIENNIIQNNTNSGIFFSSSSKNLIKNNSIGNHALYGIDMSSGTNNNFTGNLLENNTRYDFYITTLYNYIGSSNTGDGEKIYYYYNEFYTQASPLTVSGLSLSVGNKTNYGQISLINSSYINFNGNDITSGVYGIYMYGLGNNTIANNTISNAENSGIFVDTTTSYNNITNNTISGNTDYDIDISGYYNYIDTTNMFSGEPIYYYFDQHGTEASPTVVQNLRLSANKKTNMGHINLINSTFFNLQNNSLSRGEYGIYIKYSDNNTVVDSNLTSNNQNGIYVEYSKNTTISTSNFKDIAGSGGIYLYYADNNTITDNNFTNNSQTSTNEGGTYLYYSDSNFFHLNRFNNENNGIYIYGSNDNNITNNTFSNTTLGVNIESMAVSYFNNIYFNSFSSNSTSMDELGSGYSNYWNVSISAGGGNYWASYDEPSERCHDANGDGFCDSPVAVKSSPGNNFDYLPKMLTSISGVGLSLVTSTSTVLRGNNATFTIRVANNENRTDNLTLNYINYSNAAIVTLSTYNVSNLAAYSSYDLVLNVQNPAAGNLIVNVNVSSDNYGTNTSLNVTTKVIFSLEDAVDWRSNITNLSYSSVVWADIDNDSDYDLTLFGSDSSGNYQAFIYIYNGVTFTENSTWSQNITKLSYTSAAYGDLNKDGYLDLVALGNNGPSSYFTQVYINNGSTLNQNTAWSANLTQLYYGSLTLVDIDNDGDLDLISTGQDNSGARHAKVAINNGTSLLETPSWYSNMTGVYRSSIATGDLNGDSYLDLVLTGTDSSSDGISKVYINNQTSLVENSTWGGGLQGVEISSIGLADIDNDNDLDLVLTGWLMDTSTYYAKAYINNGTRLVENTAWQQNLNAVSDSAVAFGDYNNDGKVDLLITGYNGSNTGYIAFVYNNTGSSFVRNDDYSMNLQGIRYGSAAWIDVDNDNDLDLAIAGHYQDTMSNNYYETYIYNNTINITNTAPSAPTTFTTNYTNNKLSLTWSGASDTETGSNGLYYNIKVGTCSGCSDIVNSPYPVSSNPAQGYFGNMFNRRSILLNGSDVIYYWRVQTIDSGMKASSWSTEQSSPDNDSDSYTDTSDNCPEIYNPDQADWDGDSIGNLCDIYYNATGTGYAPYESGGAGGSNKTQIFFLVKSIGGASYFQSTTENRINVSVIDHNNNDVLMCSTLMDVKNYTIGDTLKTANTCNFTNGGKYSLRIAIPAFDTNPFIFGLDPTKFT